MNINDRNRPYSGQVHTDFGERGKTLVTGLTMRDIVDCYCRALLHSCDPNTDLEPGKTLSDDPNNWVYNDIYKVKCAFDPGAVGQNLTCEIEKAMGIYPNVPMLYPTEATEVYVHDKIRKTRRTIRNEKNNLPI